MTNFEKFGEELNSTGFGVVNGKPVDCDSIVLCAECDLFYKDDIIQCVRRRMEWLKAEYEEPKITIPEDTPIDTKVLVSDDGITWNIRYYAGTMDGIPYVWADGFTSWTSDNHVEPWEYMKLYE